jgi:hypothetical protein
MKSKVFYKAYLLISFSFISCNLTMQSKQDICFKFRKDIEKNWKRIDGLIFWDPTVTFERNDKLISNLQGKYNSCLIGIHKDSIVSLFGQTTQVSPSSIIYVCAPPESRNEKDAIFLRFHLSNNKVDRLSVSNGGSRID